MNSQPVVLIGPARSGTKILRDTIATHPDIRKVAYDISFVWKKYNESTSHDELAFSQANPKVARFVRSYLNKQAQKAPIVIEKTVGNTLRIPFVKEILPEAKFIFLYRDGRDVVESVMRQWGVVPPTSYLIKKMLSVPFLQVFPYLLKYGMDTVRIKFRGKASESYVWGVRYKGCEKDLQQMSLLEFCAAQWNHCAEAMLKSDADKLIVYYEDLVQDPSSEFQKISSYLNLNPKGFDLSGIQGGNPGRAQRSLSDKDYGKLNELLSANLHRLGYSVDSE
jgi:hypothetical protein